MLNALLRAGQRQWNTWDKEMCLTFQKLRVIGEMREIQIYKKKAVSSKRKQFCPEM